ncbi:hypothetical protein ACFQRK_09965 [Parapedobacter sp. GCM10030251]|uniref:hypothetical protein n=1 Tax=Parapedobacter sp. GCM10030251 TaxID=3273419 RepID=UPI00361B3978
MRRPNRFLFKVSLPLAVLLLLGGREPFYTLKLDVISSGYDGEKVWFHPRAGIVSKEEPQIVLTLQKWWVERSDVFFALSQMISSDLGGHWSAPAEQTATLGRHTVGNGLEIGISDFTPKWHAKTGKLLGTGHTVRYQDNTLIKGAPRSTAWSVFNETNQSWSAWDTLKLPNLPMFYSEGAGSTQRVDLPNGDILLPTYFMKKGDSLYSATVLRCRFDGKHLEYVEHGDMLKQSTGRGFPEPSLTCFKDRFYLTLRNDDSAYVASSTDFTSPSRKSGGLMMGSHWKVTTPSSIGLPTATGYTSYIRGGEQITTTLHATGHRCLWHKLVRKNWWYCAEPNRF